MKPKTVKEFMNRAREAGQDAFGIANDPEAVEALERAKARQRFLEFTDACPPFPTSILAVSDPDTQEEEEKDSGEDSDGEQRS